jgi:hypothetical protein
MFAQVFIPEAWQAHAKHCFSDLMVVIVQPGGLHPKMAAIVDSVLNKVEKVRGDIGRHK